MDDIVFIGDWVKDRVLGSGSFGTVVLWKHKRTDEQLAIKTCKWGDELTIKHRDRWTKEVEMLQQCSNPNIVGTKELPVEFVKGLAQANPSKLPILCMEFCGGGNLRQLLNKPENCSGVKETQARQILSDICNALQFLHKNKITHRDLKPENIVMQLTDSPGVNLATQNQRKVTYKLIDLGYAKEIDSNSVIASFVGTLQYLAPEIFYSKTYSNSVDYWSFGILAFEVICGTRPFLPFLAPVQWMPVVKKKGNETICIYESFHGDIVHSNEIFPENHVSKRFKELIEKWLRVALEYDPKLRGRDAPSKVTFNIPTEQNGSTNNIVFFNLLENIMTTKVIKIFSVSTLTKHSYEIDDTTKISTLKNWLSKDTQIPVADLALISQLTFADIDNGDLTDKYYNENSNVMIFAYSKTQLTKENVDSIIPLTVQRALKNPKGLYNFKNSQNLYKTGMFFVMSQMEVYDSFINGLYTKGESLKVETKQLLVKHNNVDKSIGKLLAQEETIVKIADIGKKHVKSIRENGPGTNYLGGFEKLFKDVDDLQEKINKLQSAWSQLTVRLQSAARRSNEALASDLNNFVTRYNYQQVFTNAVKAFFNHKKSEFYGENRSKERQCQDIIKICDDCFEQGKKFFQELQNQPFILKVKDLSIEFNKISEIIITAGENTDKLTNDLSQLIDELTNCTWSTLSILATDAEKVGDLPYSVVSFQKRDFKIGDSVSNHCIVTKKQINNEDELKSLIEDSFRVRKSHMSLSEKLNMQKQLLNKSTFDFSFLNE